MFFEKHQGRHDVEAGDAKRFAAYRLRYGRGDSNMFDLSQNADGRPRVSVFPKPCISLTTRSRRIYCQGEDRCLSAHELLAVQGFQDCEVDPASGFSSGVSLNDSSEGALARLAGNAMSAPCVGPLL